MSSLSWSGSCRRLAIVAPPAASRGGSLRAAPRFAVIAAAWVLLLAGEVQGVKRRAFVTSVSGTGDLGSWPDAGSATGLAAGDAICRARAAAGGLPNASTYRAWLSTSATDAYCHVQGLSGKKQAGCSGGSPAGAGPWYLFNGASNFTAALEDLANAPWEIYRPVLFDEFGDLLPSEALDRSYWTATDDLGTLHVASPLACADWQSGSHDLLASIGDGYGTASRWSAGGFVPACDAPNRLLCLEPGESEATRLGWAPGALVFLSSASGAGDLSSWPEAGGASGLAAGDAICSALANSAHLPAAESFVAWLSTASVDAKDRILAAGPFRRVDAYAVANSLADLVDGSLATTIHVEEDGTYVRGTPSAFTGTLADGTYSGESCNGWGSDAISSDGTTGRANVARLPDWTEFELTSSCNNAKRLYCFSNRIVLFWDGFDLSGDLSRWSASTP